MSIPPKGKRFGGFIFDTQTMHACGEFELPNVEYRTRFAYILDFAAMRHMEELPKKAWEQNLAGNKIDSDPTTCEKGCGHNLGRQADLFLGEMHDFRESSESWEPLKIFSGYFEGQKLHKITF